MGSIALHNTRSLPSPQVPQAQARLLTIDVLRGFALFGILYSHMIFWYSGGPLPEKFYTAYMDIPSGIAVGLYVLFFNGKFFSLFSFLFGLSFYIQIKGLVAKHENAVMRFGWRLLILGLIGLIHHAVWRADILSIYVPLGFMLLLARNLSNKAIAILGVVFILNIPTKVIEVFSIAFQGTIEFVPNTFVEDGKKYFIAMNQSSFIQVIIHNVYALKEKLYFQLSTGRLFITFGFFLVGMLAGRLRWFEDIARQQSFFKKAWKRSWQCLAVVAVAGLVVAVSVTVLHIDAKNSSWIRWLSGLLADVFNASMTVFYIAGISLLMLKPNWNLRLSPLSHIGKMALTSYLSQTLFGVFLFFHFGLGLFLETSPALNIVLCCLIFYVQLLFCKIWLQHFHYGPVEWLWRSATYFKWQPLRKASCHKWQNPSEV